MSTDFYIDKSKKYWVNTVGNYTGTMPKYQLNMMMTMLGPNTTRKTMTHGFYKEMNTRLTIINPILNGI